MLFAVRRNDAQHRAEDLLARDGRAIVDFSEYGGLDEIAAIEMGGTASAGREARALFASLGDVRLHAIALASQRQRSHLGRRIERIPYFHLAESAGQHSDEVVVASPADDQRRQRRADLSGEEAGALRDGFRSGVEVVVVEDERGRFAAELERAARDPLTANGTDAPARGSRPGETDLVYARMRIVRIKGRNRHNAWSRTFPRPRNTSDPHVPYRVLNDTVRFLTLEADQNDDLNGDGDQGDLVVQVLNVRQACHNGSPAGACHTLAAISAGICTTTAEACAGDDACGVGGTCFTPPFGCIGGAGGCCDTDPEDGMSPCGGGGTCGGGEFCQPVLGMPGQGTCRTLQGPCLSDADCTGGATCNTSDQNFQRLLAPVNALRGGDVFTASGRCIEDYPSAVCATNADCETSQFCRNGTCHRAHGVCKDDAGCPTGSTCSKELTRAAVDDADLDELPDLFDNCPLVANIMQEDGDGDGVGDACEQQLIAGGKLMLKDKGGDASKRKLAVISKDPALVAPPPGSGADPTRTGAELRVFNPGTQEQAAFALPSAGWKGLGTPPGVKGYKYVDKDLVNGPCKKVLIRPGKLLKAVCSGSQIGFTLDEPVQGSLALRFSTGGAASASSCLRFGGTVVHDTQATAGITGKFKAVDAAAPPACPVP